MYRAIEEATGRDCETFAYPSGDYDLSVIEECRRQGFRTAFAVMPHLRRDDLFERPRVDAGDGIPQPFCPANPSHRQPDSHHLPRLLLGPRVEPMRRHYGRSL